MTLSLKTRMRLTQLQVASKANRATNVAVEKLRDSADKLIENTLTALDKKQDAAEALRQAEITRIRDTFYGDRENMRRQRDRLQDRINVSYEDEQKAIAEAGTAINL